MKELAGARTHGQTSSKRRSRLSEAERDSAERSPVCVLRSQTQEGPKREENEREGYWNIQKTNEKSAGAYARIRRGGNLSPRDREMMTLGRYLV